MRAISGSYVPKHYADLLRWVADWLRAESRWYLMSRVALGRETEPRGQITVAQSSPLVVSTNAATPCATAAAMSRHCTVPIAT